MNGMEDKNTAPEPARGLTENLVREVLRTPAIKEILLLGMKGIDPDNAPGLVRTMLWEDSGVSLSLFGSLADMVNWLLEFLLELGRQLDDLPEPLLAEILGIIGEDIDRERLREIPGVYAHLMGRLVSEDETGEQARVLISRGINAALAGADRLTSRLEENREATARTLAGVSDELDAEALGRVVNRLLALSNATRLSRKVTVREQCRAVLSQIDGKEVLTAAGGMLMSAVAMGWAFIAWSIRSLAKTRDCDRHQTQG